MRKPLVLKFPEPFDGDVLKFLHQVRDSAARQETAEVFRWFKEALAPGMFSWTGNTQQEFEATYLLIGLLGGENVTVEYEHFLTVAEEIFGKEKDQDSVFSFMEKLMDKTAQESDAGLMKVFGLVALSPIILAIFENCGIVFTPDNLSKTGHMHRLCSACAQSKQEVIAALRELRLSQTETPALPGIEEGSVDP